MNPLISQPFLSPMLQNPVIHSAFVTLLMVDLLFQRGRGVDKPTRDTKL